MKKFRLILILQLLFLSSLVVQAQDDALSTQLVSYDNNEKFFDQYLFPASNGLLYSVYLPYKEDFWKFRVLNESGEAVTNTKINLPENASFICHAENESFVYFVFTAKINKKPSFALLSIDKQVNELSLKSYPFSKKFKPDSELLNSGLSKTGIVMEFGKPIPYNKGYFIYLSFDGKIKELSSDKLIRITPWVTNYSDQGPAFAYYNNKSKSEKICLVYMNEMEEFVVKETKILYKSILEIRDDFTKSGTIIRLGANEFIIALPLLESESFLKSYGKALKGKNLYIHKIQFVKVNQDEIEEKIVPFDEELKNTTKSRTLLSDNIEFNYPFGFVYTPEGLAISIEKIIPTKIIVRKNTTNYSVYSAVNVSSKVFQFNNQFEIEFKSEVIINYEIDYSEWAMKQKIDKAYDNIYYQALPISQLFVNNDNLYLGFLKEGNMHLTRFESDGNQDEYIFKAAPESCTINPFEKVTYYQGVNKVTVKQYVDKKVKKESSHYYLINSYDLK